MEIHFFPEKNVLQIYFVRKKRAWKKLKTMSSIFFFNSPPPLREQLCNRYSNNKNTHPGKMSSKLFCSRKNEHSANSKPTHPNIYYLKWLWNIVEKLCAEPHAGPFMAERPLVSPGQKGHGCRCTQAPYPLRCLPGTVTGHPPYSVRKVRDLGMETREIVTLQILR